VTIITMPTTGRAFEAMQYSEGLSFDVQITIARAGNVITRTLPGWRWRMAVAFPPESKANRVYRQQLEAIVAQLRGGGNWLAMFNPSKPAPVGGLTGAPLVKVAVSIGDTTASLKSCNAGVVRGDVLKIGNQRVMVVADATPAGGDMTVVFEPPARQAVGVDTAVVWSRPTSNYVLSAPEVLFPYDGNGFPGFGIECVEVW
jgi:hypothetical protein